MNHKAWGVAAASATLLFTTACSGSNAAGGDETFHLRFASYNVPDAAEAETTKQWAEDVAKFREEQAKQFVSLNEAQRRAERDQFEQLRQSRKAERVKLGIALDPLLEQHGDDGLQASERDIAEEAARDEAAEGRPDPLLRESAAILADALTLLDADRKLTMEVLPGGGSAGMTVEIECL